MQRKVFRVERMFDGRAACAPAGKTTNPSPPRAAQPAADSASPSLAAEYAQLNAAVAHTMRELAALVGNGRERPLARAAGKLGATAEYMEKATETILKSAEAVDDIATALADAKTDYERGLAQTLHDHVVKIYEACNFQDLGGQRIGDVIETLTSIEQRVEGILARHNGSAGASAKPPCQRSLLNGPRLDGESGHTSQQDIDILFD